MFSLIRSLPYIAITAALAYGAHWFMVNQLENRITAQQNEIEQLRMDNIALQTSEQECKLRVDDLVAEREKQQTQIDTLIRQNTEITADRDSYVGIFKKRGRNFTNTSRAKPGLVEPIINNGTIEVFEQIEQDTQYEQTTDTDSPGNS